MTKRKTKSPTTKAVTAFLLIGVLGLASLAAYVRFAPADKVPEEMRRVSADAKQNSPSDKPDTPVADQKGARVTVFKPKFEGENLKFETSIADVPKGEDPQVFAVNQFIQAAGFLPEGSRCLGVDRKDGIAKLDFNPAFETTYGSMEEKALLDGLLTVLGQFPEIKQAQFFVEGRQIETFGHFEITDPQDVKRPPQ